MNSKRITLIGFVTFILLALLVSPAVAAKTKKPNILVIWGDDIGITNLSCYSDGLMGYRTPNIDRIAAEGVRFTDGRLGLLVLHVDAPVRFGLFLFLLTEV